MPMILRGLVSSALPVLIVGACAILVPWYFYEKGVSHGRLAATAAMDRKTISTMTDLIETHRRLVAQSNAASDRWLEVSRQRIELDQTTTAKLQEILNETASLRVGCVYDTNVMRILDDAYQRAAKAAASGIDGAMPGTHTAEQ